MERVLIVAAHPDDELLGVGGTVRKLADKGITTRAVILAEGLTSRFLSRGETVDYSLRELQTCARKAAEIVGYTSIDFCGLPDNRMDSLDLLDIIKTVTKCIEKYEPDTIFTHHHGDLNVDHRLTCEAVLTATRPMRDCGVKNIYSFETPSSTEWNYVGGEPFVPNHYVDVTETLEAKIEGMSCYVTESRDYPHPRSGEALRALARYRGSNVGFDMAEAFVLLRSIWGGE